MDILSMRLYLPAWSPLRSRVDEWNILGPLRRFTDPYRSLREAIGVAVILHAFHRQARHVQTAAMFAIINSAAPPILTTRNSLVRTPIHHVLRMYRRLTGKKRVRTETGCPAVDMPALLNLPPRKAVPLLDVSATRDDDRLTVFVINRDAADSHSARVDLAGISSPGQARVHCISAGGYSAENTIDDPETVAERVREIEWKGSFRFPP